VEIDPNNGKLEFKGRSSPSASLEFYSPIMSSIDQSFSGSGQSITAHFAFEYFNTSSSKCLFDILKKLARMQAKGTEVEVNWYYEEEDEDMKETGEDYEDVLGLSFNYIAVQDF
jgi:hypothetical protein